MGTLSSELRPYARALNGKAARIYADANVPLGVVAFMRARLGWDVLFVIEHPDLRRASDAEHYELARRLCRTLVTLDRDYLDDRRFPAESSGGVLILNAPDERALLRILRRLDRQIFKSGSEPLVGRKLYAHPDDEPANKRRVHDCPFGR